MRYHTRGHHKARYCVDETGPEVNLPPVLLCINTGAVHLQDYLTPDDADALAADLTASAAKARARQSRSLSSTSHRSQDEPAATSECER